MIARRERRLVVAGASIALAWSVIAGVLCLLFLPLFAVLAADHGTYCESIDHPSECADYTPWVVYALAGVAGGVWGTIASVRVQRQPSRSRSSLTDALLVWAGAWFGIWLWGVSGDASGRGGPGSGFLMLLLIHAVITLVVMGFIGFRSAFDRSI